MVLSMCVSWAMTEEVSDLAFYLLPARFWELASGALVADAQSSGRSVLSSSRVALAGAQLLAILLMGSSILFERPDVIGFPFPGALAPVAGAVCFILAGQNESSLLNGVLGHAVPVYIGKLSYPLYLWHWPVLKLSSGTVLDELADAPRCALLMVLIFALAAATYHLVEEPCRSWRPRGHSQVFGTLLLSSGLLAALMLCLRGPLYGKFHMSQGSSGLSAAHVSIAEYEHLGNTSLHLSSTGCACNRAPEFLHAPQNATTESVLGQPTCFDISGADSGHGSRLDGCFSTYQASSSGGGWCAHGDIGMTVSSFDKGRECTRTRDVDAAMLELLDVTQRGCLTPAGDGRPTVFIIGDSHARRLVGAIELATRGKFDWRYFGASQFLERLYDPHVKHPWVAPGPEWHIKLKEAVMGYLRPGDVLAIAMMSDRDGESYITTYSSFLLEWKAAAEAEGASFVVFGDNHAFIRYRNGKRVFSPSAHVPANCGSALLSEEVHNVCFPSRDTVVNAPIAVALRELRQRWNMLVFEVAHLFCDATSCSPFIPGTDVMAYHDTNHLNKYGETYLAPFVCSFFQAHGLFKSAGNPDRLGKRALL